MNKIKLGLVDDHALFLEGLKSLLLSEDNLSVIFDARSGELCLSKLKELTHEPDIILCDIKMTGMMGYELTEELARLYPNVKVLALSMYEDEASIIRMVKSGAKGYVLKGAEPWELIQAIKSIHLEGFYFGTNSKALINQVSVPDRFDLKDHEVDFLLNCCTELNYKEIAEKMGISFRTIDGYRERIFPRINVRTRIGAVIYCFKHGIYKIDN